MKPIALFAHPSRDAALARLDAFAPNACRRYEDRRNYDLGPGNHSNVSMLSPFIRHRLITEQEVLTAVLGRHSAAAAEKFIQEVFWRTYFKGHLETRPFIWSDYRTACKNLIASLNQNSTLRNAYERAEEGQTGIGCFDAWVAELKQTGYLHNHARMWFASIWIFTLKLPWQLGADFMYRHLLDGDPASNTLSWRWVGGLHTKGKTYLARATNIRTYTQARFSPDRLALEAPPLEEAEMPSAIGLRDAAQSWPKTRFGLLLTEEDLNPELPGPGACDIAAICGAPIVSGRSPLKASPLVDAFVKGAMVDGLTRIANQFSVNATLLPSLSVGAIEDWAQANALTIIATAYAPSGPVGDTLAETAAHLANKGIHIVEVRRGYDTRAWPHATRGFFGLKDKIPKLLAALGSVDGKGPTQMDLFGSA
jgi:deoxyribodipyrimidine photo-lyase